MALPFTSEQFLDAFGRFNTAFWPLHVVAWTVAAAVLVLALRGGRVAAHAVPLGLAALWVTAAALQGIAMRPVMSTAVPFAAAFALQAALLVIAGVRGRVAFRFRRGAAAAIGLALIAYAAFVYPLLGALAGHAYPRAPVFGAAPCPNTIFTLGVLLLTDRPVPRWLLPIPLLWCVVGASAAAMLGVPEDWGLPAAGALTVAALAWRARTRAPGGAASAAAAPAASGAGEEPSCRTA